MINRPLTCDDAIVDHHGTESNEHLMGRRITAAEVPGPKSLKDLAQRSISITFMIAGIPMPTLFRVTASFPSGSDVIPCSAGRTITSARAYLEQSPSIPANTMPALDGWH
jgi:hypothetical protein